MNRRAAVKNLPAAAEFNEASGHRKLALNPSPSPFIAFISSQVYGLCLACHGLLRKHKSPYVPVVGLLH